MTAPAAAPASAPVAAPPPRAAPQPPADAHAFAAVLDALPGGALKASASTAAEEPHPSGEKRLDQPPGQRPGHSPPGDGLLLASLPLAVQAASRIDGSPHAADPAPSLGLPAAKGPESEVGGASVAASARTAALGRLIGQRAFHFGASTSGMTRLALDSAFGSAAAPGAALALRSDLGGGLPQVEALPAAALANAAPPGAGAPASAAVRAGPHDRPARAAPHEAARGERKAEAPAPAPAAKVGSAPAAPPAEPDGDGKAPGGRSPDPVAPLAPSLAQAGPFGAPLAAAAFGGGGVVRARRFGGGRRGGRAARECARPGRGVHRAPGAGDRRRSVAGRA